MKKFSRGMAVILICGTMVTGCAIGSNGLPTWSSSAATALAQFGAWANAFITGVEAEAPAVLAAAALIPGAAQYLPKAQSALKALQDAQAAYNAAVLAGTGNISTLQTDLTDAIDAFNAAYGNVKAIVSPAASK